MGAGAIAKTVLVVEDDDSVRHALRRALTLEGWDVSVAAGGREGLDAARAQHPDVIVLDVAMPDLDGIGVARALRDEGNRTPILMLTARVAIPERITGLDAGADDYMLKPYDVGELEARLRALTRRAGTDTSSQLRFAELELDPLMQAVRVDDATIELTRTELELLALLISSPRRTLTREVIYQRMWGQEFATGANVLRVYVASLRRKLEADGRRRLIHTVHGVGYILREP
jgi:two-component system, OmpR family, response regulator MprA